MPRSHLSKANPSRVPPITLADYVRIHSVARAVMDGLNANTTKACIFFSLAGAYLLNKHHRLNANMVAGAAVYCLGGDPPDAITYARIENDELVSDDDAFHCWVECEGWAIDFMAPLFGEVLRTHKPQTRTALKMFQRPLATMVDSIANVGEAGDFMLRRNPELTLDKLHRAIAKPQTGDLVEACADWYRPTPKKLKPSLMLASNDGTVVTLQLKPPVLVGAW